MSNLSATTELAVGDVGVDASRDTEHLGVVYATRLIVDFAFDRYPGKALQDVAVCGTACGEGEFIVRYPATAQPPLRPPATGTPTLVI